jgi:hypothetical protein
MIITLVEALATSCQLDALKISLPVSLISPVILKGLACLYSSGVKPKMSMGTLWVASLFLAEYKRSNLWPADILAKLGETIKRSISLSGPSFPPKADPKRMAFSTRISLESS